MSDVNFATLLPELKDAIKFVTAAATGGIIGNRIDNWFVNLYYHEKQRIVSWLQNWNIKEEDKKAIEEDNKLKVLFSQVTSGVANEVFDRKLFIWPVITESLLRNQSFEFDKKQYFINLFLKLDPFAVHFLATLYVNGPMEYGKIFVGYRDNKIPKVDDVNYNFYLAQLQIGPTGLTYLAPDENKEPKIIISDLGSQFVDFISNSSIDKIKTMADQ